MALLFRRFVPALALLAFVPAAAHAAPVALSAGWLNSSLTFGGATYQDDGYDITALFVYDEEIIDSCCTEHVFFSAGGGSLVSVTTVGDETSWRYEGGTFSVRDENSVDPFFTAPVDSLDIKLFGTIEPDADILVTYQLGAGLFEAAFAALHGIPTKTGPGQMLERLLLLEGDAQSEELMAHDGGGNLEVEAPTDVPEPALSVLVGFGVAAAVRARRMRRRI